MSDKITIAIHTPAHADRLKQLLAQEGIEVTINPVKLDCKFSETPVTMEIAVDDMPTALRVIENIEIFTLGDKQYSADTKTKITARDIIMGKKTRKKNTHPVIILPVDFSDYSFLAARFAFPLAALHGASVVLLHAFTLPSRTDNLSFSPDTMAFEPRDMELDISLEQTAKEQMETFTSRLREYIKDGIIPPVKFTSEILEGLPETVINDYARHTNPLLIVMGTRGANKKERELVGSITAEVLDTCRYPVFTIPETTKTTFNATDLRKVALFCNLDNDDITALNTLNSTFPEAQFNVTFIHIASRKDKLNIVSTDEAMKKLLRYCRTKFRNYTFASRELQPKEAKEEFVNNNISDINFILIPNKRKHALARLFNPGLAHRLLFHTDIPMIVVPV